MASGGSGGILLLVLVFAALWFVLIRPQRARQQRQRESLNAVEAGDEILTVGGLYGIVQSIDEEGDLIVEIAEGIHVRIARRAVATVVKPEDEEVEHDHGADDGHDHDAGGEPSASQTVTVPEDEASLEATSRRLFGRRR